MASSCLRWRASSRSASREPSADRTRSPALTIRVSATRSVASLMPKSWVSLINSAALAHAGWAPSSTLSTTDRAGMRVSDFGMALHLGSAPAVITERLVAVLDRLAEAVLHGIGDECVALGRVPGDAVEHRADHSAGGHTLLQQCGIEREFNHDQLVDRHRGDPVHQAFGALVEVFGIRRLDCQTPLGRLCASDAISSQQKTFGTLITQSVRPHPSGRHPPDP